jgi:hypothetical protein
MTGLGEVWLSHIDVDDALGGRGLAAPAWAGRT